MGDEAVDAGGSDGGRALALAYRFLNRRERTVSEVRARLERAELPASAADIAVTELVELGYLDDARYARVFTQDKRTLEGWGNDRIARALRERGVEADLIEAALVDGVDPSSSAASELGRAVVLLEQRFPSGPLERRDRERAFGVLVRKGYGSETAADAVRQWGVRGPR